MTMKILSLSELPITCFIFMMFSWFRERRIVIYRRDVIGKSESYTNFNFFIANTSFVTGS